MAGEVQHNEGGTPKTCKGNYGVNQPHREEPQEEKGGHWSNGDNKGSQPGGKVET